jgi:crotonobetainyl-CoA:carnitine CoA-transferase CaiB-like acyl-CoA transferase
MLESMLSVTLSELQGVKPPPTPLYGPIATADGYVMIAVGSENTFRNLMQVIGHPEWITDPRFAEYSDRRDNWGAMMSGAEAWSRAVTTAECLARLNEQGVPSSAYRSVAEALADPQIAHRGALSEVSDGGGTFKVLNVPFRMSGADVSPAKRMATLGEHTRVLLKETGLSEAEVAAFAGKSPAARQR